MSNKPSETNNPAKEPSSRRKFILSPTDNHRLASLCGQFDENLHMIEKHLGVEITNRGEEFQVIGIPHSIDTACDVLQKLYQETKNNNDISKQSIQLMLRSIESEASIKTLQTNNESITIQTINKTIKARTPNQHYYLAAMQTHDINFGIGPSGTGKTFLAVACAVNALKNEEVERIILVRPAVEAGEKLGFLPGDLAQKIDPYLRPLYDALVHMLGSERVTKYIEKNIIEIAPLAYMRGRTLNDAFIILDEGQNTTQEQMKMFLTRIGFGSKAAITGDITQIDLPNPNASGLRHSLNILREIPDIRFTFFKSNDVVRHPLVQKIVEAYERFD